MKPGPRLRQHLSRSIAGAIERLKAGLGLPGVAPGGPGQGIWAPGYEETKKRLILRAMSDEWTADAFRRGGPLPPGYGVGVDERCVEYPWLLTGLVARPEWLLDAGSALNHDYILEVPVLHSKTIHIVTLAPEEHCFWRRGVSYLFHDLRDVPIRDGFYDTVACISTIEHVGYDNAAYTGDSRHREDRRDDFLLVMRDLRRVLKPGGTLYLTVPFGVPRHLGTFQQFDKVRLERAIEAFGEATSVRETFFRYTREGWQVSSATDCASAEYVGWLVLPPDKWPSARPVEPDLAIAARAVACVRLVKK